MPSSLCSRAVILGIRSLYAWNIPFDLVKIDMSHLTDLSKLAADRSWKESSGSCRVLVI